MYAGVLCRLSGGYVVLCMELCEGCVVLCEGCVGLGGDVTVSLYGWLVGGGHCVGCVCVGGAMWVGCEGVVVGLCCVEGCMGLCYLVWRYGEYM